MNVCEHFTLSNAVTEENIALLDLSEAYTSLEMMKKVYDSEDVITRDEPLKF